MGLKLTRTKLIIAQFFSTILLLVFALSVYVDPLAPTASGSESEPRPTLTPSIFNFLWNRPDLPKKILRIGIPQIGYLEELRNDSQVPGISVEIISWFLGFLPRSPKDLLASQLPKILSQDVEATTTDLNLEKDWGLTSVLFSLPEGETIQPVSFVPGVPPLVAVYHTHATESYLPVCGGKSPEDAFTSDIQKSVVKVGEMLVTALQANYGIPCLHSETTHDNDSRVGAYYRSEATVKAILQKYPQCQVLIDLHRDSQPIKLTGVTIRGKKYARLMFVIGTDNPNWVSNYSYAKELTTKLENEYPGITRGIFYESAVYNQKYSPKAILVEVGGVDNTFEECKNSMEALAWALATTLLPVPPKRP